MIGHDLFAQRKSYSRSLELFISVKPLKDLEDLPGELLVETYAIVFESDLNIFLILLGGRNLETRRLVSAEFDGVTNKILKHKQQLEAICL